MSAPKAVEDGVTIRYPTAVVVHGIVVVAITQHSGNVFADKQGSPLASKTTRTLLELKLKMERPDMISALTNNNPVKGKNVGLGRNPANENGTARVALVDVRKNGNEFGTLVSAAFCSAAVCVFG